MVVESTETINAMRIDLWAPRRVRASMSLPSESVPNGCVHEGGWERFAVSRSM
jgi:hypothetical protein